MSPRTFTVVAAATIIAVLAAVVALVQTRGGPEVAGAGDRVFPELLDRVNDVSALVIDHAKGRITLERGQEGWTVKESDGYPGRKVKIQRALLGLAEMHFLEPKTRLKEKYAKLNLRDQTEKGSRSKRVKLFDGEGKIVADILVGKERANLGGDKSVSLYVRRPGDVQSWLAAGTADITAIKRDWLERKIVNLEAKRIRSIVIHHPDGEVVILSKASPEAKDFTLDTIPKGKELIDPSGPNTVGRALADFLLDDARKDSRPFDSAKQTTADFTTFDGLTVKTRIVKRRGKHWMRLEATGENGAAKEARDINARTAGWVYGISEYSASNLMKRLGDLVEDEKPKS